MVHHRVHPSPDAPAKPASAPAVKIQKRTPEAVTDLREKQCADCGKVFELAPDQKFYLCPDCYRRRFSRKPVRKGDTQVLIQITCASCGGRDYLDFVPTEPEKALCRTCFADRRREPLPETSHPTGVED